MLGSQIEQIKKLPPKAHALGASTVTASGGIALFTLFPKQADWLTGWIPYMHSSHEYLLKLFEQHLNHTDSLIGTNVLMGIPFIIAAYYLKLNMFRKMKAAKLKKDAALH